jgi:hypothetical protein
MSSDRIEMKSGELLGQWVEKRLEAAKVKSDAIPRRQKLWMLTPAERAIQDAIQAIEKSGLGGPRITGAINLLGIAFDEIADCVEAKND